MVSNGGVEATPGLLVGQLAELAGVTVKTVRHYEKLGLIAATGREPNGYKRYPADAVLRVACVAKLRGAGVPLARVAQLLDEPTTGGAVGVVDVVLEVLHEQYAETERQIEE